MHLRSTFGAVGLWLGLGLSLSATPILTLTPSGDISGAAGSETGWGFTIQNDSGYIEITSAQFCLSPVDFSLGCTAPTTGTFTDIISGFNDIIVGPPGGTDPDIAMQNFDPVAGTGVGSFQIDPAATVGAMDIGEIVLTYNLTDLDPNDPNAMQLGTDLVFSAPASVTVIPPVVVTTPEPVLGFGAGLMAVILLLKALRRVDPA